MEITFVNSQTKVRLNPPQIVKAAKTILRHEGVRQAVLSLVFVSRQKIQALNQKYLGRSYATDVLAFDLRDQRAKGKVMNGDLIISTDAALKNADLFGTPLNQEIVLYMIHGILHLLGYDDHRPLDIRRMRRKEQELLEFLGRRGKRSVTL